MTRPIVYPGKCFLFLVFMIYLSARAAAAAPSPSWCGRDPTCRDHLESGIALDHDSKYQEALAEFQAAYKQQEDPRVAANIGRTLHKLGRFAEALPWYATAGRAAPADAALQQQLQSFIAQAKQYLPSAAATAPRAQVEDKLGLKLMTSPVSAFSESRNMAINSNSLKLEVRNEIHPERPTYKRAALWIPLVGLAIVAGAASAAAVLWPRPYQPEAGSTWITYSLSAVTVQGSVR